MGHFSKEPEYLAVSIPPKMIAPILLALDNKTRYR